MPADDLVLNVRQIAGYPPAGAALPSDALLLLRGGLGGPYLSIDAQALVSTALQQGGPLGINAVPPAASGPGEVFAGHYVTALNGGAGYNAYTQNIVDWFYWQNGPAAALTYGPLAGWQFSVAPPGAAGQPAAMAPVMGVSSVGNVIVAGGVTVGRTTPLSPDELVTAGFIAQSTVTSFNLRTGAVILDVDDIVCAGGAPAFSPRFDGCPRAPTPAPGSYSTRIATTAFVRDAITEFDAGVLSFNGRSGVVVLTPDDVLAADGAMLASPAFTGVPTAPTAATATNTDQLATCAYVAAAITGAGSIYAPIDSPSFTGNPTGPTADPGTATGQLATTAFVQNAVIESTTGVSSFMTRTGAVVLLGGDITTAGGALLASPAFTGTPTAPTAAPGTSNTQLATTAFVQAAAGGVTSFNGRNGAIVLTLTDVTGVGGAPLNSPIFTGVPAGPTAAPSTSSTQLATTAFVMAALASTVTSFNSRTGAITLTANDISAAGGAPLNSPAFFGVPTAPTAATATNTTQLATTAFVQNAIGAGAGVVSFNGRGGAITLTAADLTGAGGALLSSPAFTGTPSGPTAAGGVSTTQLATTAFVQNAVGAISGFLPIAGGTLTGPLTVANTLDIDGVAGSVRALFGTTAGLDRWRIAMGTGGAGEPGANSGSDFGISRYSDAGALIDSPFFVVRATGQIQVSIAPNTPGTGQMMLTGAAGTAKGFVGATNALPRWGLLLGSSDAETGGNAGSSFNLNRFNDAGAALGNVIAASRVTGVVTFAAAIVNGPSDRTLKENIEPLTGSLDKVLALQGKSFNMIGDPRRQIGLIAQDVEPIVPEVIQPFDVFDPETGQPEKKLALDYPKFTALLIEAIKTLAARLDRLEAA